MTLLYYKLYSISKFKKIDDINQTKYQRLFLVLDITFITDFSSQPGNANEILENESKMSTVEKNNLMLDSCQGQLLNLWPKSQAEG